MTAQNRYRLEEGDGIKRCVLEDITLLYHQASGQTHMVISPVPEIVAALQEGGPATAAELHARLSREYQLGDAKEAAAQIEAHLAELAALGLVRAA